MSDEQEATNCEYEFMTGNLKEFIDWVDEALVQQDDEYFAKLKMHINNLDDAFTATQHRHGNEFLQATGDMYEKQAALGSFIHHTVRTYLRNAAALRVEVRGLPDDSAELEADYRRDQRIDDQLTGDL